MSEYIIANQLLLKHFDHLWPIAYPKRSKKAYTEHRKTVEHGTWNNLGGLLEHAIHTCAKLEKFSTVGKDFVDESDAKLASVRTSNLGKSYSAPISNIHQKKNLLRVVVYERKLDKFYYFLIPHSAYKNIPKTSNIEIPFNLDGTPKKENKCKVNWWNYSKDSFLEICAPTTQIQQNIALPTPDLPGIPRSDPSEQISNPCIADAGQLQMQDQTETQPTFLSA